MERGEVNNCEASGAGRSGLKPAIKDLDAGGQVRDYRVVELFS